METRVLDKKGDHRLVRLYVIIGFYRLWSPTIQMETRLLVKKDELWRKDPSE